MSRRIPDLRTLLAWGLCFSLLAPVLGGGEKAKRPAQEEATKAAGKSEKARKGKKAVEAVKAAAGSSKAKKSTKKSTKTSAKAPAKTSTKKKAPLKTTDGAPQPDIFTVHEWGTCTSLQDELGRELAGINVDDEPVPAFVHNLSRYVLNPTFVTSRHWRFRMKAVPRRHPFVTMRLETPVIYFYPPAGAKTPFEVDVSVKFRGGWLSEFYPDAKAVAPGIDWQAQQSFVFGELKPDTISSLRWKGLRVGTDKAGPKTDEHVWLAPRDVDAAFVQTPKGEAERLSLIHI